MNRHKKLLKPILLMRRILLANAAILAATTTTGALAESSGAMEEIVVTAQQREQNIQDVPISMSTLSGEEIDKNRLSGVSDYISKTPNASYTSSGARSRRDISIRGITNFTGGTLRTSTFGFYVDGFNVAGSSVNPPIMDVERIEILRGPQATYFGRNALGGGINVTSKKPRHELTGSLMADYSRYDTMDVEGVLNIPMINNVLAARINVKDYSTDGNIENINPQGGGNDADYEYVKASVLYTPSDDLSVLLTGSYADEVVGMREGVPSGVFSTFAGETLYASFPDRDGDGKADPDPDGVGFYPENQDKVNFNSPQEVGTDFKYLVARVDYDFSGMRFTSITGYIESDFFLQGDIDGGSGDYFNEFRTIPRESFSQEFRLQSTGGGIVTWNLGAIYAEDKASIDNKTFVGSAQPFGLPDGFLIDSEESDEEAESWAVFGQIDYMVTDRITVAVGGRYSEETKKAEIEGFGGAVVTRLKSEDTFTDFSPKLSVNYHPTDNVTLYGTATKGFKSGGVQISPLPGSESYDPETLWNYELGLKSELFDRRLRLNAAIFYMDWEDLQASFQESGLDADGNFIIFGGIDNAEEAESQGVELSGTALITDNLVVNFNVGYLDAKYKDFVALIDGANRRLDGKTIPNSPKWTASADVEYAFNLTPDLRGYVRGEWTYRDEIRSSTAALIQSGFPWEVPSYDFVNLRFGIEHNNYSVVAYVENAFDEEYYTNAYQKAFMSGLHIEPSVRRYGVRVKYFFN